MIQMATQISFLGLSGKRYFAPTEAFRRSSRAEASGREIVANAASTGKNLENPAEESSRIFGRVGYSYVVPWSVLIEVVLRADFG